MELLTLAAIIVVMIAIIAGTIAVLKSVTAFYRQRFQFSIWSGALLFVLALSLIVISGSTGGQEPSMYVLVTVSTILAVLTIYNDIRLAGFGWGALAVGLQILLSFCLMFIVMFAVIAYIARSVFNVRASLFSPVLGVGIGTRGELLLLMHFLHL